jgi:CrcB protein
MIKLLFVALGGAAGSLARYGVGLAMLRTVSSAINFPWGTLAVNVIGGFLIGSCVNAVPRDHHLWYLIVTGFLGGFTTFSAFSLETVSMLRSHQYGPAFAYVALSLLLAFAGVIAGMQVKADG